MDEGQSRGGEGQEGVNVKYLGSDLVDCGFDLGGFHEILKLVQSEVTDADAPVEL